MQRPWQKLARYLFFKRAVHCVINCLWSTTSADFSAFKAILPSPQSILEHFHHPEKKLHLLAITPSLPMLPHFRVPRSLLSGHGFACWGHLTSMGSLCLAPFTQPHVLEAPSHCSVCWCRVPFYGRMTSHCAIEPHFTYPLSVEGLWDCFHFLALVDVCTGFWVDTFRFSCARA